MTGRKKIHIPLYQTMGPQGFRIQDFFIFWKDKIMHICMLYNTYSRIKETRHKPNVKCLHREATGRRERRGKEMSRLLSVTKKM
jgi:hypothetical protein